MGAVVKTLDMYIRTAEKKIDPFEATVLEYLTVSEEIKRLEEERRRLRRDIIRFLNGKNEAIVGGKKVILKKEKRQYLKTKDVKKFLAEHGVLDEYVEEKEVERLLVI